MGTETDPVDGKDDNIYHFMWRRFGNHCSLPHYEAVPIYQDIPVTLNFDWLYGKTSYKFVAYVDNMYYDTNKLTASSVSFTTESLPSVYEFSVFFTGIVKDDNLTDVRNILAKYMGINPL